MLNKLMWKWIAIIGCVVASVWLLYPTIEWYSKTPKERTELEVAGMRPKRILNLGLDLRGGTYMVLELDITKLPKNETVKDAIDRAIEILRNRIDQYGVGETPINRQGERWISVQLPGVSDPAAAEELIGKTALLEFRIVSESPEAQKALEKVQELGTAFDGKGKVLPEVAKLLPVGTEIFKSKQDGYLVLSATVPLTGAHLENARVETGGNTGFPHIAFKLDAEGGKIFGQLTAANIHKRLAIVLDGMIHSAPNINSRINSEGIIEGSFTMEQARNLAIVLRAGALPAPVSIIEKRTVGASLGEDSIRKGLLACLYGFVLVLAFILIYYKVSGLVSGIALCMNFLLLVALMAYFGATLTLPGIAGVLLSLAMAIDANVLILERMREEYAAGKPIAMIIPQAYERAWSAILDSNVTTWIACIFLFQFGSGPVKGFAVTLMLGLLVGMFTAVYVTRAVYEFWLTSNPKEISI